MPPHVKEKIKKYTHAGHVGIVAVSRTVKTRDPKIFSFSNLSLTQLSLIFQNGRREEGEESKRLCW